MDLQTLQHEYAQCQAEATRLAGGLGEIPRRVTILYHMYLDSGRNHVFPQIAAHGALWAFGYFEVGGRLGRFIAHRYFYNREERSYRLGLLNQFAEGFRTVNRQVCIDTYANYHFTREHGEAPGADQIIPPTLLDALNRVHAARRAERSLSAAEKRSVFEQSFFCEQEVTVAPGVKSAVDGFDCRILRGLCLKPLVRFAYFPSWRCLLFRNFSDKQERIDKGFRAYDYAERMGWDHVRDSMRSYRSFRRLSLRERTFFRGAKDDTDRLLPERFFQAPSQCFEEIQGLDATQATVRGPA